MLGHLIDDFLQDCNDRQTSGIAVGPDASRIISEVLLAAVDQAMASPGDGLTKRAVRMVDDVTFYARTPAQASEFVERYTAALETFELQLNASKLIHRQGVVLPTTAWVPQVSALIAKTRVVVRDEGFAEILDELLRLSLDEDGAVLSYFLAALPLHVLRGGHKWQIFEDFLKVAIRMDSSTISHAHRFLVHANSRAWIKTFRNMDENLHEFAERHLELLHPYEVAFTINVLTDLGTVVDNKLARSALSLRNDFVDLLLLEVAAKARRLRAVANDIEDRAHRPDVFESGHWLLGYEVQRHDQAGARSQQMAAGAWGAMADQRITFMRDPSEAPDSRWYLARLKASSMRSVYAIR